MRKNREVREQGRREKDERGDEKSEGSENNSFGIFGGQQQNINTTSFNFGQSISGGTGGNIFTLGGALNNVYFLQ